MLATIDESVSALVAESVIPSKSQEEIANWPSEVVLEISRLANKLNGFDEGKD